MCIVCRYLGFECEYKCFMWWSNNEYCCKYKDNIKMIIKCKKFFEKLVYFIFILVNLLLGFLYLFLIFVIFIDFLDCNCFVFIDLYFFFVFNFNSFLIEYGYFNG